MTDVTPDDVLGFWIDEVGPKGWYAVDAAIDATIREKFGVAWEEAARGGLQEWRCGPARTLAYVILTDQFPRNMFRGAGSAFATDARGRAAALRAIGQRWDLRVEEPQRQFFYLPLMHSEVLADQEKATRLILTRMPKSGEENLLHARAHREVIRRFGRFPYRNAPLQRRTTPEEQAFLDAGGYGAILRELQAPVAA
jgi:uncharacterized protein (DUF924 family)